MLLHVALGFVLIPLKPDILKFVFNVQLYCLPLYPSSLVARMVGHHSFGQRKAAGTAGLTQAFAPSVAGIRATGYSHAIESHLSSSGKNQHREDDMGIDGGRAD